MGSDDNTSSQLPVRFESVKPDYERPDRRNALVPDKKYDTIDDTVLEHVRIGTNGVTYVPEAAFPKLLGVNARDAAYIFDNQIPDAEKREYGSASFAHSAAVVGLLDKKAQETRKADNQALLQYSRDSLINVSDSDQAESIRRRCDTYTERQRPKLSAYRGGSVDELTGEPLRKNAAFHHVNPVSIHTDPEDALNPSKGRMLNRESHVEVHKQGLNDETMFEEYKERRSAESGD